MRDISMASREVRQENPVKRKEKNKISESCEKSFIVEKSWVGTRLTEPWLPPPFFCNYLF
jgi:hypothetical protein